MLRLTIAIAALVSLTASAPGLHLPDRWTCAVRYVIDGESFECDDIRIRPKCVRAPEKGKPGFHLAKSDATNLVMGKQVVVSGPYRRSRKGLIATVTLDDGRSFSDEMQKLGWPKPVSDTLCS